MLNIFLSRIETLQESLRALDIEDSMAKNFRYVEQSQTASYAVKGLLEYGLGNLVTCTAVGMCNYGILLVNLFIGKVQQMTFKDGLTLGISFLEWLEVISPCLLVKDNTDNRLHECLKVGVKCL